MQITDRGKTQVFVAGGGVSGIAAALSAARHGKKVVLAEKTVMLGGLATLGLVNLFVPMCNGRGRQIALGMAEEFARLSVRYGYGDLPEAFQNGRIPQALIDEYAAQEKKLPRYSAKFSPEIFALQLTELLHEAGVTILFDSQLADVEKDGQNRVQRVTLLTASGFERWAADVFVDATGSAQLAHLAGMRTRKGQNFHTFAGTEVSLERCKRALESGDISRLYGNQYGGRASLYGKNHPEGMATYDGTSSDEVNRYFLQNHLELLSHYKDAENRKTRDLVTTPGMPLFREIRCIEGEHTFRAEDAFVHFDDSVAAIPDFDRRDYLYEVPFRCLIQNDFPNVIAVGRNASAEGYGWDVLRVIPPAILTGQAAGLACAQAIERGSSIPGIDVRALQDALAQESVMIHFDDEDVPETARDIKENNDSL